MNKFIHTTIKLSFLSVIISMAALLNTAPTAGATTQTAHNGQSVVDNRLILDDDILNADLSDTVYLGQEIKIDRVNYAYYPIYKSIPYKTIDISDR